MIDTPSDADFLAEVTGYIDALDRETAEWGRRCTADSVHRAFRAMHTLKGAAGFMGKNRVEALAHAIEEVISTYTDATPARVGDVLLMFVVHSWWLIVPLSVVSEM